MAADRAALDEARRRYAAGGMRLRDFRIERNGNGRDFDVLPSFQGDDAHGYRLRLEAVGAAAGGGDALLHESGYYVDAASELRIFVRQEEIRQRIPGFAPGRPYTVRATLVLDVGSGGPGGAWSEAFIERVFPLRERSQSLEREVRF